MLRSPQSRWAVLLGFAAGGFFDGVLLHQILQWHHLLSLVRGVGDLRAQVMWDGVFHAAMYLLALMALWGLWRTRGRGGAGGSLPAAAVLGFGLWNVVDAVVFHWILEIHHIRLDTAQPLSWDLGWFAVFGVAPVALGWFLLVRRAGARRIRSFTLSFLIVAAPTVTLGAWSLRPAPSQPFTTVVFRADASPAQVFAAVDAVDARLVWAEPGLRLVTVRAPAAKAWRLYLHGAVAVTGAGAPGGCAAWTVGRGGRLV